MRSSLCGGLFRCRYVITLVGVVFAVCVYPADAKPVERIQRSGPVEATMTLEPPEPLIGDAVTMTLSVAAEKGVELLMPEFGQALERFAILDFSSNEQIDQEGRTVVTQRYQLQPSRSGLQSIPPLMIEFVDRRDGATPARP